LASIVSSQPEGKFIGWGGGAPVGKIREREDIEPPPLPTSITLMGKG